MVAEDAVKKEDVEQTLEELNQNKNQRVSGSAFGRAMKKFGAGLLSALKKIKSSLLSITVRTTLIDFLLTSSAVTLISIVLVSSVELYFSQNGIEASLFLVQLRLTAIFLSVIIVLLVTFLSALSLGFTLSPLRRIIKQVKEITAEDLSKRLDEEGSENEIKELAVQINKLLASVDVAYSRQKKLVSDASHELKTPISVIQGYSQLLMRWGKDQKEILDEGLESIAREADNMKRIVEQLLFLAKIGKYILNKQEIVCSELLTKVVDGYKLAVPDRSVVLRVKSECKITSDPALITECVRAIVDNAIKYSPADTEVIISCEKVGDKAHILIQDFGAGIKEEDKKRIFDRFYRCDNTRTRGGNSTGLGLTICKSITELLGADIKVESELNKGSIFTLIVPNI
jgi:signal transduction histidine kinase